MTFRFPHDCTLNLPRRQKTTFLVCSGDPAARQFLPRRPGHPLRPMHHKADRCTLGIAGPHRWRPWREWPRVQRLSLPYPMMRLPTMGAFFPRDNPPRPCDPWGIFGLVPSFPRVAHRTNSLGNPIPSQTSRQSPCLAAYSTRPHRNFPTPKLFGIFVPRRREHSPAPGQSDRDRRRLAPPRTDERDRTIHCQWRHPPVEFAVPRPSDFVRVHTSSWMVYTFPHSSRPSGRRVSLLLS
mmetsp:Transcript_6236/g.12796  ORF Transcript_6236/g.12796 Transcript_6236/m.12796 type:complete len:238 (-) Transcript_6236:689-1402(-)